jgi:hypothetical protein
MAKRTSNRSSAEDTGAASPTQPKPRRQKATAPSPPERGIQSEAADDAPLESMSMASEPSEEDIRMRAYHRYLERGSGHGMDFEDWLEAERELKK